MAAKSSAHITITC